MFKTAIKSFPVKPIETDAYTIPLLQPEKWMEAAAEGELSVDVYETETHFVVQTAIAGVRPDALALSIQRDLLTIRGERASCAPHEHRSYLVEECFWGRFSRSVILPEPVDVPRSKAELKLGVLTITLPKLIERNTIAVAELE
ncbi:MAG: Hsp20/alpha crystallin family protein [bacterium]|nr:Hsp20/alpha crystallin family protein [bacterium]